MDGFRVLIFVACLQAVLGAAIFQNYNDLPDFIAEKVEGSTRIILIRYGRVSGIQTIVEMGDEEDHVVSMVTNGLALAKVDSAATADSTRNNEECFISADEETVEEFLYVFDAKFRTIDTEGIIFLIEIPGSEVSEFHAGVESSSDSHSSSGVTASSVRGTREPITSAQWDEWNLRHGIDNQIPHHLQNNFDQVLDIIDLCMTTKSSWKKVRSKLTVPGIEPELVSFNEPNRARRAPGIYPGTVWCGLGNAASSSDDIGEHADTDTCCKDHDFCPEFISPFSRNFGQFNLRPYTINLCDCDIRLRQCLRDVNSTVAMSVGHLFFNVFTPVCFDLEEYETCTYQTWWGSCYEYGTAQRAIIRENRPWNI